MLKYLPDEIWNRLPLADYRARFFVESYIEKLRLYTPHFYQSRLMNVFSSCCEMLNYISDHQLSKKKNSKYILASLDEVESTWDQDSIARSLLKDLHATRVSTFALARRSLTNHALGQLRALCRAITSRQSLYSENLAVSLKNSISSTTDLKMKGRILSEIYDLTGLYITDLLNKGHSPTYLFNRAELFTRHNRYGGRNFLQQFEWITEKLGNQAVRFDVHFGIHTNKPSLLLNITDEPGFAFSADTPAEIGGQNAEKLRKNIDINVFAKYSLDATDPVTAALRAKERIDKLLDAVTALEMNPQFRVSPHCITFFTANNQTYSKSISVDLLLAFMSSEVGTYFSHSETSIRQAFKGLDETAKDQLGRSLRYLRLARDSVSIEQKLLNLWISLESLFERDSAAILSNMLDYVPKLYSVAGIRRRVRYLRDLLVANSIAIPKPVAEAVSPGRAHFDEHTCEEDIFRLLRNESAATKLFDSLGNREHLKFKLLSIFNELKDNNTISRRLRKSERDVVLQLRRIYFLRNKIAHTGHHSGVRPQLATHLLDYIAICYKAISNAAAMANNESVYSIGELLLSARMGADIVVARTAPDQPPVSDVREVLLVPVI